MKKRIILFAAVVLLSWLCCGFAAESKIRKPIYLDSKQPIDLRVADLLSRMTLKEKIGQMNEVCVYLKEVGKDIPGKFDGCRRLTQGAFVNDIGPVGALKHTANIILHEGPYQQAEFFNELQEIATKKTRLKIPIIQDAEGVHGVQASGATIFPEGLAIGSSWNMDLVRKIYSTIAKEARAIGAHQLCTLVIEPNRDPRMGRCEEGYSEDPYLCSRIAEAIPEGAQGRDISANDKAVTVLCHFPGQSQPVSGLERGAMDISERSLREVWLPPWVAGIKKAGALAVMATYPAIDGVPTHSSERLLTRILREELGFNGYVLSEGGGIGTLLYERVAATRKQASELAVKAGVDLDISFRSYRQPLIENIREGKVSIEAINRSVRRILKIKFLLGLFENPYVDPDRAVKVVHCKEHQELALQAAREGIVLLKNENNILPLDKNIKSIAVVGANADNDKNQLGDYIAKKILQDIVTVFEGIKNKVSAETKVVYVKGCQVLGTDIDEISKAQNAARNADVAIVVVGESAKTDGESHDVTDLDLTGLQEDLVKAVYETGTPTVVVLINGRPLSIRWIAEHVPAILEAWFCGEQGGNAVADVLFGDYNPSGRLPITIPRHVGQLPVYYNYKPSKASRMKRGYVDRSITPLFEFGYGLCYTKFEYSNLSILPKPPAKEIGPAAEVLVKCDVKNIGDRRGDEVVQLYINDAISSVTTPVKQLEGFKKVRLDPGQVKTVEFTLTPSQLSLLDRHLERVVEPGTFEVMVGSSSQDIRLKGSFEVEN